MRGHKLIARCGCRTRTATEETKRMAATGLSHRVDSPYAWRLAFVSMFCIGLGGGAIYLPVVGLREIAAEFGDPRAVPSIAYMLGFLAIRVTAALIRSLPPLTLPR